MPRNFTIYKVSVDSLKNFFDRSIRVVIAPDYKAEFTESRYADLPEISPEAVITRLLEYVSREGCYEQSTEIVIAKLVPMPLGLRIVYSEDMGVNFGTAPFIPYVALLQTSSLPMTSESNGFVPAGYPLLAEAASHQPRHLDMLTDNGWQEVDRTEVEHSGFTDDFAGQIAFSNFESILHSFKIGDLSFAVLSPQLNAAMRRLDKSLSVFKALHYELHRLLKHVEEFASYWRYVEARLLRLEKDAGYEELAKKLHAKLNKLSIMLSLADKLKGPLTKYQELIAKVIGELKNTYRRMLTLYSLQHHLTRINYKSKWYLNKLLLTRIRAAVDAVIVKLNPQDIVIFMSRLQESNGLVDFRSDRLNEALLSGSPFTILDKLTTLYGKLADGFMSREKVNELLFAALRKNGFRYDHQRWQVDDDIIAAWQRYHTNYMSKTIVQLFAKVQAILPEGELSPVKRQFYLKVYTWFQDLPTKWLKVHQRFIRVDKRCFLLEQTRAAALYEQKKIKFKDIFDKLISECSAFTQLVQAIDKPWTDEFNQRYLAELRALEQLSDRPLEIDSSLAALEALKLRHKEMLEEFYEAVKSNQEDVPEEAIGLLQQFTATAVDYVSWLGGGVLDILALPFGGSDASGGSGEHDVIARPRAHYQ